MSQKGFVSIIYILVILLISSGVIGGSFYIKNNLSKVNNINKVQLDPNLSPYNPRKPSLAPTPTSSNTSIDGNCTDDSQCPNGYKCIQGCGPPVARDGDKPPGYFCELKELADKPRNCPICLASNTQILTPTGDINVKDLKVGMNVYSINRSGQRIIAGIVKISSTSTPITHKVIHLILIDGRQLWLSPNHPTINGLEAGQLQIGQSYDGSVILITELIPYWETKTYDLLPNSETGFYWANGILMASTLKQ